MVNLRRLMVAESKWRGFTWYRDCPFPFQLESLDVTQAVNLESCAWLEHQNEIRTLHLPLNTSAFFMPSANSLPNLEYVPAEST